ncbi:hypothetical protein Aperf_G00000051633 [Anoplocephala perfoliata]
MHLKQSLDKHSFESSNFPPEDFTTANQYAEIGGGDGGGGEGGGGRDGGLKSSSFDSGPISSQSNQMTFLGIFLLITVFTGLTLLLIVLIYFIKKRITVQETIAAGLDSAEREVNTISANHYFPGVALKKEEFLSDSYSPPGAVYGTSRTTGNTDPIESTSHSHSFLVSIYHQNLYFDCIRKALNMVCLQ